MKWFFYTAQVLLIVAPIGGIVDPIGVTSKTLVGRVSTLLTLCVERMAVKMLIGSTFRDASRWLWADIQRLTHMLQEKQGLMQTEMKEVKNG
ncbi:unnamed protein product [Knipowitschia caucasica]|uniref:Potassium channel domain-containing protein n=1 Tax=Knipowitschia caucasica TaxID=637954 RepID=A0AAV2MEN0_KNICA